MLYASFLKQLMFTITSFTFRSITHVVGKEGKYRYLLYSFLEVFDLQYRTTDLNALPSLRKKVYLLVGNTCAEKAMKTNHANVQHVLLTCPLCRLIGQLMTLKMANMFPVANGICSMCVKGF